MPGELNSVIDLMFLHFDSSKLNQHSILLESRLSSDHTPLTVTIPLFKEIVQTSKLILASKSNQESEFIQDVISNFKGLDMTSIEDSNKLNQVIKQFSSIIDNVWTKNQEYLNIPNNGGQKIAAVLSTSTDHQEVLRIGRNSRRLSKTPRDHSSMTKFKKLQIKVTVPGN